MSLGQVRFVKTQAPLLRSLKRQRLSSTRRTRPAHPTDAPSIRERVSEADDLVEPASPGLLDQFALLSDGGRELVAVVMPAGQEHEGDSE